MTLKPPLKINFSTRNDTMKKAYNTSKTSQIPGARVAILQAKWHNEHTDKMVEACSRILKAAKCAVIEKHVVPGSYELPLAAKRLAKMKVYDAIVIFGAVVKGETDHYEVILQTCIRELGRVMYDFEIPIIMELMPVHDLKHLIARSTGKHNKGIEAAQATIDIIRWTQDIGSRSRI